MRGDGVKMAALLAAGAVVGAGLVLAGARAAHPSVEAPAPVRIVVVLPDVTAAAPAAQALPAPVAVPAAAAEPEAPRAASAVRASVSAAAKPERVANALRASVAAVVARQRQASASPTRVPAAKPARLAKAKAASASQERVAKTARAAGLSGHRLSPEVVARLRKPKGTHSDAVRRLLERAGRLLERGARWDALALYARVLRAHPGDADAMMGVALCRFELGDRKTARRLLDRLLARAPSHARAAILRGFVEQLARRPAAAVTWYQRALEHLDDDAALAEELRQVVASLGGDARPSIAEAP